MSNHTYSLGIDLGSISLKLVLIDERDEVVFERWVRVAGQPLEALERLMAECVREHAGATIRSAGATGSGRGLIVEAVPAKAVNEISAHATASDALYPEVRTIIEIGGQDSKLIVLDEADGQAARSIGDFRMNELCAAGTGAFLDQQAARLGISIDEFAALAECAAEPAPIAGRCAVFAKTDMTHHQQEGRPLGDIVAGLNHALVRSYMANLVRGRELPVPIAFQGGVAANRSLVDAFRKTLNVRDDDLAVPKYFKVMGALGAAIKSRSAHDPSWPIRLEDLQRVIGDARAKPPSREERRGGGTAPLKPPRGAKVDADLRQATMEGKYLGIDVGSVSVKLALVGPEGIIDSDYAYSDGKPVEALRRMLGTFLKRAGSDGIDGVGVTGSGRHFVGNLVGADAIVNEISAQARAAHVICPDADTVFEIGGQDAKFMRLEGDRAVHFSMNRVCAAGTGAFLQEQAKRLEVDLERDFAKLAFESGSPAELGARCTVFMESDLVSHQQTGCAKRDIIAGLARSVVLNYMEKVVAGHPPGERALFLGGVAENAAVVSALEAEIGRPVSTSSAGKLSGAIGAALAAVDEVRAHGRRTPFVADVARLEFTTETCTDCPNHCRVSRTPTDPPRYFGGRCGKWDGSASRRKGAGSSPLASRRSALFDYPHEGMTGIRVGIPRALMAYDSLPAWRTFFAELGCEVVLSPDTDDKVLGDGMRRLVVETCLPVKSFCSHVAWLDGHGVDFIFVPSLVITGKDAHDKETAHCPYLQSLVQFARPLASTPIINPVINWKLDPKSEGREMAKIAPLLGRSVRDGRLAWKAALAAQKSFRSSLKDIGRNVLNSLRDGRLERAFVLMGKDYNILDDRLSSGIASIFESMGETVVTQDMLVDDSGDYSDAYRTMYWSHGKEILAAAQRARDVPNLHPVLITSFGCGPDSFTIRFARDIIGEKPFLILEVDEHSSPVGMETRIEAFIDSLRADREDAPKGARLAAAHVKSIRRVFLPNFSDHGYAFAAALKVLGFTPVLTELPDDASARLGAKHSSSGECHPYVLMLGSYLKAASRDEDLSDACYYMPESGACRVGQFGTQMRLAAEEMGVNLPVCTRIEEIASSVGERPRLAYVKALVTYWEMMRGMDFLMQKHLEKRAYETKEGAADAARLIGHRAIEGCIDEGRPLEGLKRASLLLDKVPIDSSQQRVKIGMTGDYYTRICDYSNGGIFREIERLGGQIMLPPTMSDFVKYDSRQKPLAALRHGSASDFAVSLAVRGLVDSRERRVREIFGSDLDYGVPLDYNRAKRLIAPYMDMRLPAGLTGSVAAIMEQIAAGADGIVSAITFHCNYGLSVGSVLSMIDRDYPDIPKITLIFEGLKPNHNRLRLEAFMERVHEKAQKRRGRC
jgi:predicted CoA-substrate-specific enzyme activase